MIGSGWPDDWPQRKAGIGCGMCAAVARGAADGMLVVGDLPGAQVWLPTTSRLDGYCIVAWRGRHVAEPTELDAADANQYWYQVLEVARAVEELYKPVKMNLLTLGNREPHLHTHVVPRHADDPAPGDPIAWDEMFTDSPPSPESLRASAERIRHRLGAQTPAHRS